MVNRKFLKLIYNPLKDKALLGNKLLAVSYKPTPMSGYAYGL